MSPRPFKRLSDSKHSLSRRQGGCMKHLGAQQFMGMVISLTLISDPLFAAFAPLAATGMDASPSSPSEERTVPTAASAAGNSDTLSGFKLTSVATNTLPLPKTPISMD